MVVRVYSVATAFNARSFLVGLLDGMAVSSIQVGGGSEFMADTSTTITSTGPIPPSER